MATTTGGERYNQPIKYTKTLTLTMSDGSTKELEGTQAARIEKYLDFMYITVPDT